MSETYCRTIINFMSEPIVSDNILEIIHYYEYDLSLSLYEIIANWFLKTRAQDLFVGSTIDYTLLYLMKRCWTSIFRLATYFGIEFTWVWYVNL
jgi:hypothetical protein